MNLSEAVTTYVIPEEAHALIHTYKPLGLAGPTGAGKGTMTQYLTQTGEYAPIVSDTTRAPRPHANGYEVNGVHYWFLSEQEALEKIKQSEYIEAKLVHGDTLYGTSISAYERVVESDKVPILEIDVQGLEEFMKIDPDFDAVLLLPPSFEIWNERIDGRGDMTLDSKIRRFKTALDEYSKPFENSRFYPVLNTEVVDTAELIRNGAYRDETYRQKALEVARELRDATQAFLDSHAEF